MRGKVSFSEMEKRDSFIASLTRQNVPVGEIAKRFDLKEARILLILKKRRVKPPGQKGLTDWEIEQRDNRIEKLALQDHPLLSTKQIAKLKGLSENRVTAILKKRGVRALNEEAAAMLRNKIFARRAWLYTRATAAQIARRRHMGRHELTAFLKQENLKRKYPPKTGPKPR